MHVLGGQGDLSPLQHRGNALQGGKGRGNGDSQTRRDAVSKKADFLLKDYAIFNQALILVNNQKYAEAREILGKISQDSRAFELATLLKHYLVTK